MKLELEAMAASKSVSRSSRSSTVAFSWEHKPGVSKQNHSESKANKPAAGARRAEAVSRRTTASSKKQTQAQAPPAAVTAHHPHRHRLRVPPPPGGPGAPAASPPGSSHRFRPADDPFLAAYLACTKDGANGRRDYRGGKLLGWTGLGLGFGLGMRGLGLSCKSSCEAVEECVVRIAKIPGLDED